MEESASQNKRGRGVSCSSICGFPTIVCIIIQVMHAPTKKNAISMYVYAQIAFAHNCAHVSTSVRMMLALPARTGICASHVLTHT